MCDYTSEEIEEVYRKRREYEQKQSSLKAWDKAQRDFEAGVAKFPPLMSRDAVQATTDWQLIIRGYRDALDNARSVGNYNQTK
jgi:hypothetical protein